MLSAAFSLSSSTRSVFVTRPSSRDLSGILEGLDPGGGGGGFLLVSITTPPIRMLMNTPTRKRVQLWYASTSSLKIRESKNLPIQVIMPFRFDQQAGLH